MRQSIRLGRVAGIPIGVHWSVVVIVGLIAWVLGADILPAMVPGEAAIAYWAVAAAGALLFVVALLAHELAHAFVARRVGVDVRSITLWALGGVAELEGEPPTARSDLAVALVGPATSLAAALVFAGLALILSVTGAPLIAVAAAIWLTLMNGLLAVFNLLPGAPLDGGRVLRALLWMRHGDRARAARTATGAGRILGGVLIGLGAAELIVWRDVGGLWLMLIGVFLMSAAAAEATAQVAADAVAGLTVADVMAPHPAVGAGWMSAGDFIDTVALHSTQTVFPVIGFDGALIGVVELGTLARLPRAARMATPLQRIALAVPPAYLARPQDPAKPLLTRPPFARELLAVVTDEGRIVGLVTTEGMRQAISRARLRSEPVRQVPADAHAGPGWAARAGSPPGRDAGPAGR